MMKASFRQSSWAVSRMVTSRRSSCLIQTGFVEAAQSRGWAQQIRMVLKRIGPKSYYMRPLPLQLLSAQYCSRRIHRDSRNAARS
jgi:hypothetical protein